MAFTLFPRRNKVVNLVFNDHSIRYVEVKQTNPPQPQRWGERLLPSGIIAEGRIADAETLGNILEECLDEWKIQKREVRFLVPDSFVIIRKVSIPADVKDDEVDGYLYLELGSTIHLPFEEPVFDVLVLSEKDNKKQVLVFAAPEKLVTDYSELLSDHKLKPIAADISPLALHRLYVKQDRSRMGERLLTIQFDLQMVTLCVFEKDIPIFMRHIPVEIDGNWDIKLGKSGVHELDYIGDREELNYQFEDIYKDINKFIDFDRYSLNQAEQGLNRILLNGDHPMLGDILPELKNRFNLPVDTLHIRQADSGKDEFKRSHYLALGLGLKEGK
ncbi:type IV pilus biogenesis protein PilM [Mesobacillus harenae]|uniref:type IV pilus biogenesis protein PilM n=1 Tax=Mesobacillus harenae TaxID=2213203 RepID=UPI001580B344|nr:pilus assembly protein PilM [Mesobacillus harenae]